MLIERFQHIRIYWIIKQKISEAMITVLRNIFEIQPDKEIFENVKKNL